MDRARHVFHLNHLTDKELSALDEANAHEHIAIDGQKRRRNRQRERWRYWQSPEGKREAKERGLGDCYPMEYPRWD